MTRAVTRAPTIRASFDAFPGEQVAKPKRVTIKRAPGFTSTPEYRAWQTMRQRCTNPKNRAYPSYGGRGITICDRWLNSPETFLADMGPRPSPKHEIDRIDNDKGYSPENCRWATRKVNDRNRRSNRMIEFRGETRALVEWCEMFGVRPDTVTDRLDKHHWPLEKALTTPARKISPKGQGKDSRPSRWKNNAGENNGSAKLKVEQVRLVRELAAAGAKTSAIVAQVGVSRREVRRIVTGQRWSKVA